MNAAEQYVLRELATGRLTAAHIIRLTADYQAHHDLEIDGMPGPATLTSLALRSPGRQDLVVVDGWLQGLGVDTIPSHASWSMGPLLPSAIVAHYTATGPGTAETMAQRRLRPRRFYDRAASWHFTVTKKGRLVQQLSCLAQGMHAKDKRTSTARVVLRDHDQKSRAPNQVAIGVELEGHGDRFPVAQVEAATRLWTALVAAYEIPRDQAMVAHADLDPKRRVDPGPVFMSTVAPEILAAAYA